MGTLLTAAGKTLQTLMDDGFLIRQVTGGNRNAFRLLILRYERPLFKFLAGFGVEQAVAEELAQEAFLRAYRSLATFDSAKSAFSSWLFTIAKHLVLNETARSARRIPHVAITEDAAVVEAPPASHAIEDAEQSSHLRRVLETLPTALRSALVLAYLKEHSMEEIAAIEGCSVGTVKSRIYRGKQLLRLRLAETEE
jgi:RNA polymerase sigma-70 factor, ECF subfamily